MGRRYASDDDPEDIDMYYDDSLDIDGRDINGNFPSDDNDRWDNSRTEYYHSDYFSPSKYHFKTEEDLITSEVFQRCLGQALAHKDREINSLREEIMNGYWRVRECGCKWSPLPLDWKPGNHSQTIYIPCEYHENGSHSHCL